MPTTFSDQFWLINAFDPPPVGTPLSVVRLDITDENDNGVVSRQGNDSVGGSDITRVYPGDTITVTLAGGGTQTFTGVTLKALMERLDGTGKGLRAHAINNYAIDIPWADVADGSALIAHHRNGATMSVREKGPLWLVYPSDSDARVRQETYHARSIWQLDRIDVLP